MSKSQHSKLGDYRCGVFYGGAFKFLIKVVAFCSNYDGVGLLGRGLPSQYLEDFLTAEKNAGHAGIFGETVFFLFFFKLFTGG